jgi:hypothetical protein
LAEPKNWFRQPNLLVAMAATERLVASTKMSNQKTMVEIQPNFGCRTTK